MVMGNCGVGGWEAALLSTQIKRIGWDSADSEALISGTANQANLANEEKNEERFA
jgi:hypothetical protein